MIFDNFSEQINKKPEQSPNSQISYEDILYDDEDASALDDYDLNDSFIDENPEPQVYSNKKAYETDNQKKADKNIKTK